MNENEEEMMTLQKKCAFFFNHDIAVHIFYKRGNWVRGRIISINGDFFMLDERLNGEIPVFFAEIANIEKLLLPRGDKKDGGNDRP